MPDARTHLDPGAPPLAAESVAVLGAWIGALRTIGCRGLRVAIGDQVVHGEGATSAWAAGSADRWQLRWLGTDPASATVPRGAPGASLPATPPLDCPLPWPQPAADLARWMAHDLAAAHRVADAAAALGLSLRTLQRQLAAAGTSYRSLLGEVRVRRAAVYLARPGTTLAEIGFLCGFADQAHFTREFTRRAGLPPARYRGAATAR